MKRISTVLVRKYLYLDRHRHHHRLVQVWDHFYDDYRTQQSIINGFKEQKKK